MKEVGSFPTLAALFLAAWVSVAWAGCGGDVAQTVSAASLSQAEFTKEANAICARNRLSGLRFEPDSDQSERDAVTEGIEDGVLPSLQDAVDEIYDLGAPSGQERQVEEFLVALQKGIDDAGERPVPTFVSLGLELTPSSELAQKLGLKSCAFA
jgi:hypothetical protein